MRLTENFHGLVQRHAADDPAFGEALPREGIDTMLIGGAGTGKAVLRNYIEAAIGFGKLGEASGSRRALRMFGPRGNPQARDLFSMLGYLEKRAGLDRAACDGGTGIDTGRGMPLRRRRGRRFITGAV